MAACRVLHGLLTGMYIFFPEKRMYNEHSSAQPTHAVHHLPLSAQVPQLRSELAGMKQQLEMAGSEVRGRLPSLLDTHSAAVLLLD